jgi:2',3'-cyclic-nucleotide 2'-phosphodiesterase (5'-nucleotidase family)
MSNMSEGANPNIPMGGSNVSRSELFTWGGDVNGNDGIKIGILAVAEDWLKNCSQLMKGEIVYTDYIACARKVALELKSKGAEFIIAITHNVYENDKLLTAAVSIFFFIFHLK